MKHNELYALRMLVEAFRQAAKYHCHETHETEKANSSRATAMLNKCLVAREYIAPENGNYDLCVELCEEVISTIEAARVARP